MAQPTPRNLGSVLHRLVIFGVPLSILVWWLGGEVFPQATAAEWHRFPTAASGVWLILWLIGMLRGPRGVVSVIAGSMAILFFFAVLIATPL